MKKYLVLFPLVFLLGACATEFAKTLKVPQGVKIAVIDFRDCLSGGKHLISGKNDCDGSGKKSGEIFVKALLKEKRYDAIVLERPVGPKEELSKEDAVKLGRSNGFMYILNGEVNEYFNAAPMLLQRDKAAVSVRLIRVSDGGIAATFSDKLDASNLYTPEYLMEIMANTFTSRLSK